MKKEIQDLAWQCLTKEAREKIREEYKRSAGGSYIEELIEDWFGYLNVASNTEPSELLFVEREKVQDFYREQKRFWDKKDESQWKDYEVREVLMRQLKELFGDKCLPDKEPSDLSTQDKETMEEKELDLTQLLKGCEGGLFYSPICGECKYRGIIDDEECGEALEFGAVKKAKDSGIRLIYFNSHGIQGEEGEYGQVLIFPSRALYEKYPLDAKKAWQIWAEERKPKRWRANMDNDEYYYHLDTILSSVRELECNNSQDNLHYKCGNYFRTLEQCQQAAEAVRKTLEEFHAKNTEK